MNLQRFAVKHSGAILIVSGVLLMIVYVAVSTRRSPVERFSQPPKLILIYADWCSICVTFKPLWDSMGSTVTIGGQTVRLEAINETETDRLAPYKSNVTGYPTLLLEANGDVVKYSGARTPAAIQTFLQGKLSAGQ